MNRPILLLITLIVTIPILGDSTASAQQPAPAPEPPESERHFSFTFGGNYLGVSTEDVTKENYQQLKLREQRGVRVRQVSRESPAERAGLRPDDVILKFDGETVNNARKLSRLVGEAAPEQNVRLLISRGGAEQELTVTLGQHEKGARAFKWEMPNGGKLFDTEEWRDGGRAFALAFGSRRRIGVSTVGLTKQLGDYFGVSEGRGALVTAVTENGPAAKAGLKAGDIITEVDGERVGGVGDLTRALNRKKEGEVSLTVVRDKAARTLRVTPETRENNPGDLAPAIHLSPAAVEVEVPRVIVTPPRVNITVPRIQITPRVRPVKVVTPQSSPVYL